jgi:hypothetical protein
MQFNGRKVGITNTVYNVSADGRMFIINSVPNQAPPRLTVVTSWIAEVKK